MGETKENCLLVLPRYVLRDVAKPTLVALGVMLGLVWLLQSLRYLDFIINKGLGAGTFLNLTLLLIPLLLTIIVPLAVFVGSVYSFRRWQDDNELTALLAGGRSPLALVAPALGWALAACLVGFWLYLDILPRSTSAFKDMQYRLRTQEGQLLLEEGTFNQLGDNLMVYLKQRITPTQLDQLLVHDTREPGKPVTWYARGGKVALSAEGTPQLVLENGVRQEVGGREISMLEFSRYTLDIQQKFDRKALEPRMKAQEEYMLPELIARGQDESLSARDRHEMRAEMVKRLLWPLTPLPLVMLAAGWLVRPPRRTLGSLRLMVGAGVCAVLYEAALMGFFSLAEGGNGWALHGQWLLPIGTICAGWIMLDRAHGRE